jgi:single-strand DNA-binding protein
VIATEMQLLGSREGMGGGGGSSDDGGGYSRESYGGGSPAGAASRSAPARKPTAPADLGDMDDDIPF